MPRTKSNSAQPITKPKPAPYFRKTKNSNKEWEEARCTICMEHPHKAVLLICSSHDKGCRPFLCDSPFQYDCLTQYRAMSGSENDVLPCPLCRGHVTEKRVIESAVMSLDLKVRCCKSENCEFSGTREDLAWHWWVKHSAGPSEVEAKRKKEWERMERVWESQDIDSAIGDEPIQEVDHRSDRSATTSTDDNYVAYLAQQGVIGGRRIAMSASRNFWRHRLGRQNLPDFVRSNLC